MIYAGEEPANWFDLRVGRILEIRNFIDGREGAVPVVLATIPDPGLTPAYGAMFPDAAMRAAASAKIAAMNAELITLAGQAGNPVADIHAAMLPLAVPGPVEINRIEFLAAADPENPSDHLYCRDGIHPARVASGLIAAEVVEALNELRGVDIEPVTNREVLEAAPGIEPDQPFLEWIATQGVGDQDGLHDNPDGDWFDNLAEFTFDLHAATWDPGLAGEWTGTDPDRYSLLWRLAADAEGYVVVVPERSSDLADWTPLDDDEVSYLGSGRWRGSIDSGVPAAFLRASIEFP
jgi:hypothetical protein